MPDRLDDTLDPPAAVLVDLVRFPAFGGAAEGVTDLEQYAVSPGTPLMPDFFVPAPGARTVVGRG